MLRLHVEERDAADIAAQAVAAHRARAEAAGLALTLRVDAGAAGRPVPVLADPGRLRQALGNLVSNAITHTPAGGTVTVGVGSDAGAAEHLPRLFDRFYRADPSRNRATGGSCLGLAIAKHLAEAHGGRIDVASTPGEGTTFTVRLPGPTRPAHAGMLG